MKKFFWTVGLGCIGLLFIVAGIYAAIAVYRSFNPYLDREISGPTLLAADGVEITPPKPLRAERVVQQVVLYVEKPVKATRDTFELILPDGSKVIPEVQLVDEHGNLYDLTEPSEILNPNSPEALQRAFGRWNLPKDKLYRSVRIKSAKPVPVAKIVWRCYDPQDLK